MKVQITWATRLQRLPYMVHVKKFTEPLPLPLLCHLQQHTTVKGVNSSQSSVALLVVIGYRKNDLAPIYPDTHTYSTGRLYLADMYMAVK